MLHGYVCPPYLFQPNSTQWHILKNVDIQVFSKTGRHGCSGSNWIAVGQRACGLRDSLLVFRQATQDVGLLCLVACGAIAFLYYDFYEVVLHPCGLTQEIRDLANLHLGNPQQMRSHSMLLPEVLLKPWKCQHMKLRKLPGSPKWIFPGELIMF